MRNNIYMQKASTNLCNVYGVCGKNPIVSALQDLLIYGLKGLSTYAKKLREFDIIINEIDSFTTEALFSTVSNANFTPEKHKQFLMRLAELKQIAAEIYIDTCVARSIIPESFQGPSLWVPEETLSGLIKQGEKVNIQKCRDITDPDILSLQELVLYGLKGISAYLDVSYPHSGSLKEKQDRMFGFFHEVLDYLTIKDTSKEKLKEYALSCGEVNLKAMEMLHNEYSDIYGLTVPTKVNVNKIKGKAILVTGHDLKTLEELLKQSEGKNVNIYTHGEMISSHAYPELKKYKHLVGHIGESRKTTEQDFCEFPGPILITSNFILEPLEIFRGRIYTTGPVGWGGTKILENFDCKDLIETARECEGFKENEEPKHIIIGFKPETFLKLADKILDLIYKNKVKQVFLVGGCNSSEVEMKYYKQFAKHTPRNSMVLTLGCGQFKLDSSKYDVINGIPRIINIGQCNDAYSIVKIATDLAQAFDIRVTHIPLTMILSWQEQKSIAMLLSMLYLGIENIKLGPSLPVFVSPNIYKILEKEFNISPISLLEEDIKKLAG